MGLKIRRKWQIYVWKIVLFVGLICLSSLSVFTMDHIADLSERYSILFTLLLTQVAFQYVVAESLPSLTYLTLLDWYVVAGFVYLILTIVGVGIIGWFEHSEDIDNIFGFAMIALYFVFNFGFVIWGYTARKSEVAKLTFGANDYKKHNYRQDKDLVARSICYGVPADKLSFTKEARAAMCGKMWQDLPEGYDL